jgi:hypothetical protein
MSKSEDDFGDGKYIPKGSKKKIVELAEKIQPVITIDGHLTHIKPSDLFNVSYVWDPKPTQKAIGLKAVADIRTYHGYGYYGFFKPSVAEVIAQIPENLVQTIVAFEIVESPETADDLNKEPEALNEGFHVAKTRLYAKDPTCQ